MSDSQSISWSPQNECWSGQASVLELSLKPTPGGWIFSQVRSIWQGIFHAVEEDGRGRGRASCPAMTCGFNYHRNRAEFPKPIPFKHFLLLPMLKWFLNLSSPRNGLMTWTSRIPLLGGRELKVSTIHNYVDLRVTEGELYAWKLSVVKG